MQSLMCEAGHLWEREPSRGRPPKACPSHASAASRQAAVRHRTFYAPHPRERKPKPARVERSADEVRASARAAAKAKWARISPETRAEMMRKTALRRWPDGPTHEPVVVVVKLCPYCGAEMRGYRRRQCGAAKCRLRYNAERSRGHMHERRARMLANEWERFNPLDVYERDGWLCGICGEPVDRLASAPDPLSVSLDHIVPVSLGGPHTRENTRCAHLGCNCRRGNRIDQY